MKRRLTKNFARRGVPVTAEMELNPPERALLIIRTESRKTKRTQSFASEGLKGGPRIPFEDVLAECGLTIVRIHGRRRIVKSSRRKTDRASNDAP